MVLGWTCQGDCTGLKWLEVVFGRSGCEGKRPVEAASWAVSTGAVYRVEDVVLGQNCLQRGAGLLVNGLRGFGVLLPGCGGGGGCGGVLDCIAAMGREEST